MFQTLRAKLIAISVAITALSLVVLSGAAFVVVRAHTLEGVDASMGSLTRQYAQELSQWVSDKQKITASLRLALASTDPQALLQAAEKAGLDLAYFVRADKSHAFTKPRSVGYDGTARPWYQQAAAAGKPVITPVYADSTTGRLVVTLAEPVVEGGKTVAVLGSDVEISTVVEKIKAIHPLEKSTAFLLDAQNGTILVHANPALALKPINALGPGLDAAFFAQLTSAQGHELQPLDGTPHFFYGAAVQGTPWLLVVAVDRAQALLPLDRVGQTAMVATVLIIVLASVVMGAVVNRLLLPLLRVRDALENIASGEGDLTRRMDASGQDELSQIGQAFNDFADKIAAVLLRIRDASQAVHMAASEIASGNHDLSARTESQASALQETAAATEELTATVQHNAANARQANDLARQASHIAGDGGNSVQQVVHTMEGISTASRKIVDIIGVIDGIAFQTNILALNAAVEAARAGEQGRGFAVVASEVRTLAQRAAGAAKEIKTLIDDAARQVDAGNHLVHSAGTTMEGVVGSIGQVAAIVAEITTATQEQSNGITAIGQAVQQMDQTTQQNAALVEQASAAAQSLQQQAQTLAEIVSQFKLP